MRLERSSFSWKQRLIVKVTLQISLKKLISTFDNGRACITSGQTYSLCGHVIATESWKPIGINWPECSFRLY